LHKNLFKNLRKVDGLQSQLLFELSYHNTINYKIDVRKIAGFCIDLSHFKASEERWTNEFEYVFKREAVKRYFIANHLNGYSEKKETDVHKITHLSEFNYLRTLPNFIFGKFIALEVSNSIKSQIKFKKYLLKLLK
jgi:endonuclease IV